MGRTACTEPQCLYKGALYLYLWSWKSRAIPLLPLWAVRPVQSFSACTSVHFTFFTYRALTTLALLQVYVLFRCVYDARTALGEWVTSSRSRLLFDGSVCQRVFPNSHSCTTYSVSTVLSIYKESHFTSRTKYSFVCILFSIGGVFLKFHSAYLTRPGYLSWLKRRQLIIVWAIHGLIYDDRCNVNYAQPDVFRRR